MSAPVRAAFLLALAHHPLCRVFAGDVGHIAGIRVCSGCLVVWPVAAMSFGVSFALHPPAGLALSIGLALGVPFVLRSWLGSRRGRMAAKLLGAAGIGLAAWAMLAADWPPLAKGAIAIAGVLGLSALLALRMRRMLAKCKACPWRMDWESCPGMVSYDGTWHDPPRPAEPRGN